MKTKNRIKKPTTREVSNIQNSNKKCRTRFRSENKVSRYKNPNPYAKFLEALCWWDHLDLTWQDPRRERGLQWAPKTFKTSKNTCQQKTDTKQNNKKLSNFQNLIQKRSTSLSNWKKMLSDTNNPKPITGLLHATYLWGQLDVSWRGLRPKNDLHWNPCYITSSWNTW